MGSAGTKRQGVPLTRSLATVVLVHGAWAGSWIWERVLPLLRDKAIEAHAVDLPSCGNNVEVSTGLEQDTAAVRDLLDRVEGDIVLCGHSYGGMVITGAAAGQTRVRGLLYLCAFMPLEGQSLLGMFDGAVPGFWRIRDDLTVLPDYGEQDPRAAGDLDSATRARVASRRVAQSLLAFTQPPRGVAWRTIPSTYAVCTNDSSLPPDFQRSLASRADETVELPTGHLPQLSRPELVVELLTRLADLGD